MSIVQKTKKVTKTVILTWHWGFYCFTNITKIFAKHSNQTVWLFEAFLLSWKRYQNWDINDPFGLMTLLGFLFSKHHVVSFLLVTCLEELRFMFSELIWCLETFLREPKWSLWLLKKSVLKNLCKFLIFPEARDRMKAALLKLSFTLLLSKN